MTKKLTEKQKADNKAKKAEMKKSNPAPKISKPKVEKPRKEEASAVLANEGVTNAPSRRPVSQSF